LTVISIFIISVYNKYGSFSENNNSLFKARGKLPWCIMNDPITDRNVDADNHVLEKLDADGNTQGKNVIISSFLHAPLTLKKF
jgi:hypothetical protein